ELSPQIADVDAQRVRRGPEVVAPHAVVDQAVRKHTARVAHQQLEQLELGACELDELTAHSSSVTRAVERELSERQLVGVLLLVLGAAQQRAQARLQLLDVEGLDEVIV